MQTTTLSLISLKCSNCGANLEITSEMEAFACGYCGASQIVTRSGGTVSLRLLNESIKRVQTGTDKAAAELAIRRLNEERQTAEQSYSRLDKSENSEKAEAARNFKRIWAIASLLLGVVAIPGGRFLVFSVAAWVIATCAGMYYHHSRKLPEIKSDFNTKRKRLSEQINAITKNIEENRRIIG